MGKTEVCAQGDPFLSENLPNPTTSCPRQLGPASPSSGDLTAECHKPSPKPSGSLSLKQLHIPAAWLPPCPSSLQNVPLPPSQPPQAPAGLLHLLPFWALAPSLHTQTRSDSLSTADTTIKEQRYRNDLKTPTRAMAARCLGPGGLRAKGNVAVTPKHQHQQKPPQLTREVWARPAPSWSPWGFERGGISAKNARLRVGNITQSF